MILESVVKKIDAATARAFVTAARHVIDALLIEVQHAEETRTPAPRDYDQAGWPRSTPPGGWLSHEEVRAAAQRLAEAMAAEKWTDGLLCAVKLFALLGGAL